MRWGVWGAALAVGFALGLGMGRARAQDDEAPPAVEAPAGSVDDAPAHRVAVTISPLHILRRVVELQVEVAINRSFSVSAIAGYGKPSAEVKSALTGEVVDTISYSALELGLQSAYYLLGSVEHGMQLGAELLYVSLDLDTSSAIDYKAAFAEGLAMGPFVGYRVTTREGLTLHAQLGVQYIAGRGEFGSSSGARATASDQDVIPLLNLNAGWAF